MELQAIRYSAMISAMTFDQAVDAHHSFLQRIDSTENAEQRILDFLGWNEPDESLFAQDVRIVLASADFSKELTSTVLWLNDKGVDIRCVKMEPYRDEEKIYLDMQQVIPLPEAAEFQVQVRRKKQKEQAKKDNSKFTLTILGGGEKQDLNKRYLMYEIVKALIAKRISPEDIKQRLKGTKSSLFTDFEGNLSEPQFATELKKADGSGTQSKVERFFCKKEQLFYIENEDRTYALTNQWGKETTSAAQILCTEYKITEFEKEPKIRVRDFFGRIFRRNTRCGEILAFAAAMPGGFAGGTRPKRAEERNRGERSMTVRNAPGRNRFFCRARDAFFAFPAATAPGPSPGSCRPPRSGGAPRARRTASRPGPWHGARSCPPCSRAAGERSRCASTRSSRPAPGASARTG